MSKFKKQPIQFTKQENELSNNFILQYNYYYYRNRRITNSYLLLKNNKHSKS